MKKATFLFLAIMTSSSSLFSQGLPKIEIGSIVSLTYKNSESGESPLKINDGERTFLSRWVLLFGAEISESLALYAEVQTVNGLNFINYGLSATYQPKEWDYLNLEAGKFLVPFGTFLGRRWASENPFIDFPLIYEYRSGLSAFDLPQNESELLRVRGQGGSFEYREPSGSQLTKMTASNSGHIPGPGSGLRIISREVYLTGFQIFGTAGQFSYHFGVTNGALSNPVDINNSSSLQILGRLSYTPLIGLQLGTSISWGSYLNKESVNLPLQNSGQSAADFKQSTGGLDVSYSIGHLELYSEFILNRWESPFIEEALDALGFYLEGKYTIFTRFYIAGRFSVIDFADISDPLDIDGDGLLRESWDYDVHQLELGLGYHVNRNVLAKILGQFNRTRDAVDGDPADDILTFQMAVFF